SAIAEVILSGGDPLAANDQHLSWLVTQLAAIPHVRRLRVHTRLPVVIPARIDELCLAWLTATPLITSVVLHVNHGRDIDREVTAMVARLRERGITVLNQAVLLRGVNDSAETLIDMSEGLFAAGVLPYHPHQLDPVAWAGHLAIPAARAIALLRALREVLPGY